MPVKFCADVRQAKISTNHFGIGAGDFHGPVQGPAIVRSVTAGQALRAILSGERPVGDKLTLNEFIPDSNGVLILPTADPYWIQNPGGASVDVVIYDAQNPALLLALLWEFALAAINVSQIGGTAQSGVDVAKTFDRRTWQAPTNATVGAASAQALAANTDRRGLILKNLSTGGQRISVAIGNAAVLDSGVTLDPGEGISLDFHELDTGALNAIASAAMAHLSIQELE